MSERVYTVHELQTEVQDLLEAHSRGVWVEGEISGSRVPSSGHCYLTLKDNKAQIQAVVWRSTMQRLRFEIEDGLEVRARGYLTVYPPNGRYQMIIQRVEPLGAGPLQVKFEQMRKKLEEAGFFDASVKKALPAMPRRIGVVTSPTGAALRDIIHVAHRRWPALEIVVVATRVQGAGAAREIATAIELADERGYDLLIVGRGGGSLEDLWPFNEEVVARAIFHAKTPIVSAVGHEIDVTIADLVADCRAATPSAAAELITPDRVAVMAGLTRLRARLDRALAGGLERARREWRYLASSRALREPHVDIAMRAQHVDDLGARLHTAAAQGLAAQREKLSRAAAQMDALSPLSVLARGYSVTRQGDRIVLAAHDVAPGDEIVTRLHTGEITSIVSDRSDEA